MNNINLNAKIDFNVNSYGAASIGIVVIGVVGTLMYFGNKNMFPNQLQLVKQS